MGLFKKNTATKTFDERIASALQTFEDTKHELEVIKNDGNQNVDFIDSEIDRLKESKKASQEAVKKSDRVITKLDEILGA